MEPLFAFSKPAKHVEGTTTWHRLALQHPFVLEGTFATAISQGALLNPSSTSSARICLLNSLIAVKGIFSSVPSFAHLSQLAPPWTLLPTRENGSSTWSPIVRWNSPSSLPSSLSLVAVWISRSLIVPELTATPLPSDLIELDGGDGSPECEEVEIPSSEEAVVHLRNKEALRHQARLEVRRLQDAAQEASDRAEAAEEVFLRKYGESVSDDSD